MPTCSYPRYCFAGLAVVGLMVATASVANSQAVTCYGYAPGRLAGLGQTPTAIPLRDDQGMHFRHLAACRGGMLAVAHCYRPLGDAWSVWQRLPDEDEWVGVAPRHVAGGLAVQRADDGGVRAFTPGCWDWPRITAAVSAGASVYVGTLQGIWRTRGRDCDRLDSLKDRFGELPPANLAGGGAQPCVLSMAADRDEALWVVSPGPSTGPVPTFGFYVEDAEGHATVSEVRGAADAPNRGALFRWAHKWNAPAAALTTHPKLSGAWAYGIGQGGEPALTRVSAASVAKSRYRAFLPEPAAPVALPPGVLPILAQPKLQVDAGDHVWLCGDTLAGSKTFLFDGKTLEERTPPVELLKGRRFTALAVGAEDRLHAATDGVGVLVCDGGKWREHPINAHLPTIAGTGLKRVYCLTFDRAGNLWVGMDNNVICWRDEE